MFQAGAVGANGRVPELLEKLKAEYEKMSHETNLFKAQRDEYERKRESPSSPSMAQVEYTPLASVCTGGSVALACIPPSPQRAASIHLADVFSFKTLHTAVEAQVSELTLFQSSLAELQRTHLTIKQSVRSLIRCDKAPSPAPTHSINCDAPKPLFLNELPVLIREFHCVWQHEEEIMRLRRQLESSGIKPEPVKANLLSMPSAMTTQGLPSLSNLTGDLSSQLAAALQSHPGLGGEAGGVRADSIFSGMAAGVPGLGGMSVGLGVPHNFINVAETVRPLDGSTGKPLDDWNVVHNPSATAKTIVELQHTLEHDSVVCCVRFSNNGKYVATGCNKTAVLYDAETGQKLAILSNDGIVETQVRCPGRSLRERERGGGGGSGGGEGAREGERMSDGRRGGQGWLGWG